MDIGRFISLIYRSSLFLLRSIFSSLSKLSIVSYKLFASVIPNLFAPNNGYGSFVLDFEFQGS